MNERETTKDTSEDRPAIEALADADPADAPDIAMGLAANLQRELDQTGGAVEPRTESLPDSPKT